MLKIQMSFWGIFLPKRHQLSLIVSAPRWHRNPYIPLIQALECIFRGKMAHLASVAPASSADHSFRLLALTGSSWGGFYSERKAARLSVNKPNILQHVERIENTENLIYAWHLIYLRNLTPKICSRLQPDLKKLFLFEHDGLWTAVLQQNEKGAHIGYISYLMLCKNNGMNLVEFVVIIGHSFLQVVVK